MNPSTQSSPHAPTDEPSDDPAFLDAVQEYLTLLEAGKAPDRREYVRRFPQVAQALDKCLAGLEAVHGAAAGPKARKAAAAAPDPQLSKPLGDFQIHREIGRGGMGIVYEATQLSLGRKVALKVLPFAATFDAKHLQRFRNEAQAAAQLHHTNIVPVFAVGAERGVHFFAMQLIDGQSLSVLIDQFRERAGMRRRVHVGNQEATATQQPQKPAAPDESTDSFDPPSATVHSATLSSQHSKSRKEYFRSVARLFVQAALGVDHAHQVGIVHRDIKPANLLVDGRDNLWIADFGLAQFRSEAHLTKTGDIVGTLRYMSPEQAGGQRAIIDHRCDIYSLGATLYEMATLEPIFHEQESMALLRQIQNDEPNPPRQIDPALPVELETIILKAVSKAPSDRYATAQEMAADLQRFLDDQPILARRPSSVDRVRKWSRRHPAVVAAAIGFLIFGLVGLAANNWLVAQEQEKTRKALVSEKKRSQEAILAVDVLIQVAEQEFADRPQLQGARKKLLQSALDFYQKLIAERDDSPESQAELALEQKRVGQILSDLTAMEGAQRFVLLTDRSVQDDLNLEETERDRAHKFVKDWVDKSSAYYRDTRSLPFDQKQQKMVALIRESDAELARFLAPEDIERLGQIELQMKGMKAFDDPNVIATLQLTADQRAKIREIHGGLIAAVFGRPPFDDDHDKGPDGRFKKEFGKGPGGGKGEFGKGPRPFNDDGYGPPPKKGPGGKGPKGGMGPPPDEWFGPGGLGGPPNAREEAAHREGVGRILKVLTVEQRGRWAEMVGRPFNGPLRVSPKFGPFQKG
jgi:serine/threonine protein kinase